MNLSALTQIQAAALLSVAPRTLRDWPDAPRNKDGTYPAPALVAYYVGKLTGENEFDTQRERLAAAQAERVEMENATRRGELIPATAVLRQWTDVLAAVRAKLLSMPSKLGPQLVNVSDASIAAASIKSVVYEALGELAAWEPAPADEDGDGGAEAPAEPVGEPVGRQRKKAQQRKRGRARAVAH